MRPCAGLFGNVDDDRVVVEVRRAAASSRCRRGTVSWCAPNDQVWIRLPGVTSTASA